ncbi:MAG: hypothetical protein K9J27_02580 [Bacteroidales bacterium]|nr:hypothetical protein [Bacteroidales bacterium]MCF8334799.1 hypothetical protein [Bacteroidales bacterium]
MDTYESLQNLDASFYHAFPFSRRLHTTAARMDGQVPVQEIKQRSRQLRMLAEKKSMMFYRQHLGEVRKVLFENHNQNGKIFEYNDNYIKIEKDYRPDPVGKNKKGGSTPNQPSRPCRERNPGMIFQKKPEQQYKIESELRNAKILSGKMGELTASKFVPPYRIKFYQAYQGILFHYMVGISTLTFFNNKTPE